MTTSDEAESGSFPYQAIRLKITRSIAARTAFFQAFGLRDDTASRESIVTSIIAMSTRNVAIDTNWYPYPSFMPMARTASLVR